MGFYSKYVPATKTSTWISVLAPRECVPRLKDVFTSDPMHPRERRHDLDIHILFMQIATRSWLPYINALDDDLRKMVCPLNSIFDSRNTLADCSEGQTGVPVAAKAGEPNPESAQRFRARAR